MFQVNSGAQDVPVVKAENFSDKLQALTWLGDTDLGLGGSQSLLAIALASQKSRMRSSLYLSQTKEVSCLRCRRIRSGKEGLKRGLLLLVRALCTATG
jgi:hypothetical protein